jgi:flagellar motility protein MotE (MotC chaperone)
MKIIQSPWVASLLGLLLFVATMTAFWKPSAPEAGGFSGTEQILAKAKAPSWEFQSQDVDALIIELKQEKEALAKREKDLKDFAERLQIERLELNVLTQAVHQLQKHVDNTIVRMADEEAANIKKLARTYAAMAPDGAAPIFKEMDENTLVKIIAVMKEAESAPILEAMSRLGASEAKRVALLTERLRFYLSQSKDTKNKDTRKKSP